MNNSKTNFDVGRQIFCFGVVGVLAASIHFSIVVLLVQLSKMLPLMANIFAFAIAFQVSYWGNYFWTFNNSGIIHRLALPKLFVIQLVNLSLCELLFYIFLSCHLLYPIALLIALGILPVFTFLVSKFWVFRHLPIKTLNANKNS